MLFLDQPKTKALVLKASAALLFAALLGIGAARAVVTCGGDACTSVSVHGNYDASGKKVDVVVANLNRLKTINLTVTLVSNIGKKVDLVFKLAPNATTTRTVTEIGSDPIRSQPEVAARLADFADQGAANPGKWKLVITNKSSFAVSLVILYNNEKTVTEGIPAGSVGTAQIAALGGKFVWTAFNGASSKACAEGNGDVAGSQGAVEVKCDRPAQTADQGGANQASANPGKWKLAITNKSPVAVSLVIIHDNDKIVTDGISAGQTGSAQIPALKGKFVWKAFNGGGASKPCAEGNGDIVGSQGSVEVKCDRPAQ
jgi:hypothetical protein